MKKGFRVVASLMLTVVLFLFSGCTPENDESVQWVDLSLPSGVLWASCNVGATTPTDYGNYYAWGETQPKSEYNLSTYKYYRSDDDGEGFTKYCFDSGFGYNGFTDSLATLQPSDNAAIANCGEGARMPTYSEWEELADNTSQQWVYVDGVYGLQFVGSNGNSIFLPAAGCRKDGSLSGDGIGGAYWSSSLNTEHSNNAWFMNFSYDNITRWISHGRTEGYPVRAVRQK